MTQYRKSLAVLLTLTGIYPSLSMAETPNDNTKKLSIEERLLLQEKLIHQLQERILQLEASKETPGMTTPKSSAEGPVHVYATKTKETTQKLSTNELGAKKTMSNKQSASLKKPVSSDNNRMAVNEEAEVVSTHKPVPKKVGSEPSTLSTKEPVASQKNHLVAKEKTEVLSSSELVSDAFPGSWPMFGTDTRMKIGGYMKTDFIYDFDGTLDKDQFLMSTIPVKGTPEYGNDGYTSFLAKETRINFDIRRIKPGSPALQAFIEGDFWSNGNQLRLRHAYLNVGGFIMGQTWTTLSFLESLPYMIDFAAGDALFGGRTTQIRYTHKMSDQWKVAIGVEQLATLGIGNPLGLPGEAKREWPLLALRSDYRWDDGVLFLGTSIAQLHWDGEGSGQSDDALQYDFIVAGRQKIGDTNYIAWNVSYGEGSGENIIAFAGSNANAVLNSDGKLETMPALSVLLGGGHEWNSEWSSHLSYAYGWLDTPEDRDPLALKRGGIGHVNLLWHPVKQFSTAVEYIWGAQRVQNDALGRAQRLQFMGRFDF